MNAQQFAEQELCALGRSLVAGNWSRAAVPMDSGRALVVIAKAFMAVVQRGVTSVEVRAAEMMRDVLRKG